MDILSNRPKTITKSKKRLGRGYGSGKGGHTSGRGAKGDKARGKTKITFDGSKIKKSWIKRTPFLRGKHRLESRSNIPIFNLDHLQKWYKKDQSVDLKSLSKFADKKLSSAKILSQGKLDIALTIKKDITVSKKAEQKIVKAGGKIEI